MQQYGVTPQQIAQVTGKPINEVQARYNAVSQPQQQSPAMQTPTGLYGSEQALQGGLESALRALAQGYDQSRTDLLNSQQQANQQLQDNYGRAEGYFQPYQQSSEQALGVLNDLSGVNGSDAFNAAYQESPYMQFLAEQGSRGVLANASALGGLSGGNVMKELSRFNQGLAGQGLQQQIGNLQFLTGQGLNAAGSAAGSAMGLGNALAGVTTGTGSQLGQNALNTGLNAANLGFNTGQLLSQGRTNAGNLLAGQIANTSGNLANLANQGGMDVGNALGQGGGNLANLLAGAGGAQADVLRQIAELQAKGLLSTAGQYGGLPSIPNVQQTQGLMNGGLGAALGGIGTAMESGAAAGLAALSDARLKTNIRKIGERNGINLYDWDWIPGNEHITDGMPTTGVIAQELLDTMPEAVFQGPDGYLMVDYGRVYG